MNYLWIDLETTGTNERLDEILEIGWILTDTDLQELASGASAIQMTKNGMARLNDTPVVLEMHTKNGLLDEIKERNQYLPTAREYSELLVDELTVRGIEKHRVMLAGSGVSHFDRRFLQEHCPALNEYLAYACIDVGIIRRFWKDVCGLEPSGGNDAKTHRGLDDIRCHLEEARWFVERFKESRA